MKNIQPTKPTESKPNLISTAQILVSTYPSFKSNYTFPFNKYYQIHIHPFANIDNNS